MVVNHPSIPQRIKNPVINNSFLFINPSLDILEGRAVRMS
jgi:hypothetical protein